MLSSSSSYSPALDADGQINTQLYYNLARGKSAPAVERLKRADAEILHLLGTIEQLKLGTNEWHATVPMSIGDPSSLVEENTALKDYLEVTTVRAETAEALVIQLQQQSELSVAKVVTDSNASLQNNINGRLRYSLFIF